MSPTKFLMWEVDTWAQIMWLITNAKAFVRIRKVRWKLTIGYYNVWMEVDGFRNQILRFRRIAMRVCRVQAVKKMRVGTERNTPEWDLNKNVLFRKGLRRKNGWKEFVRYWPSHSVKCNTGLAAVEWQREPSEAYWVSYTTSRYKVELWRLLSIILEQQFEWKVVSLQVCIACLA